jgi:predicted acetyltransferase
VGFPAHVILLQLAVKNCHVMFSLKPAQADDLDLIVNLDRLSFAPQQLNTDIQKQWYPQGLNPPGRQQFLAIDSVTMMGVGTYTRLELPLFLEGQEFPATGVAGVAVAPERRGQGVARFLMEQEVVMLRSQQVPLVALYPFQHGFYRQLGWAWVERVHQYKVATVHLPTYPERFKMIPYQADIHQTAVQEAYLRSAQRHNGWLKRQAWQWESRFTPQSGREVFCYVDTGKVLGYVIVQYTQKNLPPQTTLGIEVQEWVALNGDAYRGIVGLLATLRDQVSVTIWNTYPEDPFPHLLKEQSAIPGLHTSSSLWGIVHRFGEIGGGIMWRLVDLETAFRLRPVRQGASFLLTFEIKDPVLGDQVMTANFAAGRMHPVTQSGPAILRTSIEHLTELFCGLRRAAELVWTREAEFEGDRTILQKLDAAWEATPPFCWEWF